MISKVSFLTFLFSIFALLATPASGDCGRGVTVDSVSPGGPGHLSELKPGDVIISWRGPGSRNMPVGSPFEFHKICTVEIPRKEIIFTIISGGKTREVPFRYSNPEIWVIPVFSSGEKESYDRIKPLISSENIQEGIRLLDEFAEQQIEAGCILNAVWAYRSAALWDIGDDHPEEIERIFKKAASLAEKYSYYECEAEIYCRLSLRLSDIHEYDKSKYFHGLSLEKFRKAAVDKIWLVYALSDYAISRYKADKIEEAEEYFMMALEELSEPGSYLEAAIMGNLGGIYRQKGEFDRSEEYYQRSADVKNRLVPGSLVAAGGTEKLGILAYNRGDYEKAMGCYLETKAVYEKLVPKELLYAGLLNNMGLILSKTGDYRGAEECQEEALAIRKKTNSDGLNYAMNLGYIGMLALRRGNFQKSEKYLLDSLKIIREQFPQSRHFASTLNNLANVYQSRADYEKAFLYYREAYDVLSKIDRDSYLLATIMTNLGMVALDMKDYETASEYLEKSIRIKKEQIPGNLGIVPSLINLSVLETERGNLEKAYSYIQEAYELCREKSPSNLMMANIYQNMAFIESTKGNYHKAIESAERAVSIRSAIMPGTAGEAKNYDFIGEMYSLIGDKEKALSYFTKSVNALETQQKMLGGGSGALESFSTEYADYYRALIDSHIWFENFTEAFDLLEKFRARGLLSMIAERDLDFRRDAPEELITAQKKTKFEYDQILDEIYSLDKNAESEKLVALREKLNILSIKNSELTVQIRDVSPELAQLKDPQPLNTAEIIGMMDKRDLLVSYCVFRDKVHIFKVFKGKLKVRTAKCSRDTLERKVFRFRSLLTDPESDRSELEGLSSELYTLIIYPFERELRSADRLLICTDGPLHSLPFASLTDSRGRSLIEFKPVIKLISPTVLHETRKRSRTGNKLKMAAFGNPLYPAVNEPSENDADTRSIRGLNELSPLPATEKEVAMIAALFGENVQVFTAENAKEETAKHIDSSFSHIHFACHGIVDEQFPLNSGLALSVPDGRDENAENGFLQAWEIFESMRINADLVTLSACDTALGKEMGGEGLVGLSRAFNYAGARSVLASQWKVSDESTFELMKLFYGFLSEGMSADKSLQQAQKKMKEAGYHPFHWAAFQLIGDYRQQ